MLDVFQYSFDLSRYNPLAKMLSFNNKVKG